MRRAIFLPAEIRTRSLFQECQLARTDQKAAHKRVRDVPCCAFPIVPRVSREGPAASAGVEKRKERHEQRRWKRPGGRCAIVCRLQ